MAVDFKDYYRILGVDRKADDKTIKSAYRRLARKHHPDVAKGKESGDRFKEINEAYEVLSDPEKRRRYDSLGPDWQRYTQAPPSGQGGGFRVEYGGDLGGAGDFSEFFRSIFGDLSGRAGARGEGVRLEDLFESGRRSRGGDVQAGIEISLDEAFQGARKTFAMDVEEPCAACHGAGHVKRQPCTACGGGGLAARSTTGRREDSRGREERPARSRRRRRRRRGGSARRPLPERHRGAPSVLRAQGRRHPPDLAGDGARGRAGRGAGSADACAARCR